MMMRRISKNDYTSVGLIYSLRNQYVFISGATIIASAPQRGRELRFVILLLISTNRTSLHNFPMMRKYQILVSSTPPILNLYRQKICHISENWDNKYPSNMPQIIQHSKLATFWHTITIWARSKKRASAAIHKSPTWFTSISAPHKNWPS